MNLRKEISTILGLFISDYGWADAFKAAEIQGKLTNARTNKILLALCEHMEELENEKLKTKPTDKTT